MATNTPPTHTTDDTQPQFHRPGTPLVVAITAATATTIVAWCAAVALLILAANNIINGVYADAGLAVASTATLATLHLCVHRSRANAAADNAEAEHRARAEEQAAVMTLIQAQFAKHADPLTARLAEVAERLDTNAQAITRTRTTIAALMNAGVARFERAEKKAQQRHQELAQVPAQRDARDQAITDALGAIATTVGHLETLAGGSPVVSTPRSPGEMTEGEWRAYMSGLADRDRQSGGN
jgi:hypothetical protein